MATGEHTDGSTGDPAVEPAEPTSGDPDQLVADIERTREELAGTLDAIAEKVSPKRVAARTGKKVATAVKEGAASAKDSVKEGAGAVAAGVSEGAASAKEKLPGAVAAHLPGGGPDHAGQEEPTAVYPVGRPATDYPLTPLPPSGGVPKQYLAAGAVAAVLVLLIVRRRRR